MNNQALLLSETLLNVAAAVQSISISAEPIKGKVDDVEGVDINLLHKTFNKTLSAYAAAFNKENPQFTIPFNESISVEKEEKDKVEPAKVNKEKSKTPEATDTPETKDTKDTTLRVVHPEKKGDKPKDDDKFDPNVIKDALVHTIVMHLEKSGELSQDQRVQILKALEEEYKAVLPNHELVGSTKRAKSNRNKYFKDVLMPAAEKLVKANELESHKENTSTDSPENSTDDTPNQPEESVDDLLKEAGVSDDESVDEIIDKLEEGTTVETATVDEPSEEEEQAAETTDEPEIPEESDSEQSEETAEEAEESNEVEETDEENTSEEKTAMIPNSLDPAAYGKELFENYDGKENRMELMQKELEQIFTTTFEGKEEATIGNEKVYFKKFAVDSLRKARAAAQKKGKDNFIAMKNKQIENTIGSLMKTWSKSA